MKVLITGGAGFLGVCFGQVITVNSPSSQGATPSNWEAVLWHEFCHVVTLTKTNNRMPRWLSEGISVYEEVQANQAWGQTMNPQYRQMILDGELTPVSQLSGAFLRPPSAMHPTPATAPVCARRISPRSVRPAAIRRSRTATTTTFVTAQAPAIPIISRTVWSVRTTVSSVRRTPVRPACMTARPAC